MLADIDAVVARVKQSRGYRIGGAIMILWGVIVVVANLLCATTLTGRDARYDGAD